LPTTKTNRIYLPVGKGRREVKKVKRNYDRTERFPALSISLAILLILSFEVFPVVEAISSQDPAKNLPDHLIKVAEWMSKGNATDLKRILNEMVQQEALKQEIIKSTNGAILNSPLIQDTVGGIMPLSLPFYRFNNIAWVSPDTKEIVTNKVVGHVGNPNNVIYGDYVPARFTCTGWNQDYNHPVSGEAIVNGPLTGTCSGSVRVQGWKAATNSSGYDQYGAWIWQNAVYVWASYGFVSNPHYIGYVFVTASSNTNYYVGSTTPYGPVNYLYVACTSLAWYPDWYSPHWYADVNLDTVFIQV